MRWFLRVIALALVAVVAGVGALALTSRAGLDDARDEVEDAWAKAEPQLGARYDALSAANDAVRDEGGGARSIVGELDTALARWHDATRTNANVASQIALANDLEGLGRRLRATVDGSARFDTDAIALTLAAFDASVIEAAATLNRAVDAYSDERGGTLRRLVASALGHEAIPRLDV
jgi:hypothetical protein